MAAVRERTSGARVQRGRSAQAGRGQGGRMQSGGARGRRSPQNGRAQSSRYIQGSAVRKLDVTREIEQSPKKKLSNTARKNREKAEHMSLGYVLFCTRKNGWGWERFMEEASAGEGLAFPRGLRAYLAYGIPLIIAFIYLKGYYDKFQGEGPLVLAGWLAAAVLFLLFVFRCAAGKGREKG